MPEGFVFSPDGRYLYGSSYYTGVSNIYRYEIATGKLEALSNAEIGYFRPLPLDGARCWSSITRPMGSCLRSIDAEPTEDLSAITFLGEQIATKHPVVQTVGRRTAEPGRLSTGRDAQGDTTRSRELGREAIYPIVEGYKDSVAFGAHARFSDPVGFDSLNLTLSYSPDSTLESKERLHARGRVQALVLDGRSELECRRFLRPVRADEAQPRRLQRLRRLRATAAVRPAGDASTSSRSLAYFGDLDTLPHFQNVPSPTDKLGEAQVGLEYEHPRASIGNVDDEAGHLWSLLAHAYEADGEITPSLLGKFDVGLPLPLAPLLALAAHRRAESRPATARTRSRTPTSAASATTTSTTAMPSATANCSACPGSRSTP